MCVKCQMCDILFPFRLIIESCKLFEDLVMWWLKYIYTFLHEMGSKLITVWSVAVNKI